MPIIIDIIHGSSPVSDDNDPFLVADVTATPAPPSDITESLVPPWEMTTKSRDHVVSGSEDFPEKIDKNRPNTTTYIQEGDTTYAASAAPGARYSAPSCAALDLQDVGNNHGHASGATPSARINRGTYGNNTGSPARQVSRTGLRVHVQCPECEGAGYWTLAYSLDPYGKTYRCEECDGEGSIEVEAEELEA